MKILLSLLVISSINVFAHGENKPGPHGGHIRMPGTFHTELVISGSKAKVYLLDIGFKNPITQNSQVSALLSGHHQQKVSCEARQDYFECSLPADLSHFNQISLTAVRKGVKGKEAQYPLPLSFSNSPAAPASHHNH